MDRKGSLLREVRKKEKERERKRGRKARKKNSHVRIGYCESTSH
jgi:hypothetical protein